MTSAPNRLLPLSGNNIKWPFFIILLFAGMMSCSLLRSKGANKPENKGKTAEAEKKVEQPKEKAKDTVKVTKLDPFRKRIEDSLNILYPSVIKPRYSMTMLLPLYLDDPDREHKGVTSIGEEFYKGMLIAADTLKLCGANLDIHVIDSEFPLLSKSSLRDSLEKTNCDLVIGPLLDNTRATYMDTLSKEKKINWVSPLMTADKCVGSNYYFESVPSAVITGAKTAQMIQKDYPGYRVILINENASKDNPIANAFISSFPIKDSVKIVNYAGRPASTTDITFPLTEKNVIFIPSRNETFVSSVLSKLRVNTQEIVVVGITPWLFFNTQEGDLWEKFKIHVSSPFHMDYSNEGLQNFVKEYRNRYKQEPSVWSFIGFDETVFYGKMLNEHGRYFQRYLLDDHGFPMLHSTYLLKPDTKCPGWKNTYINMLKFEDYRLQPAD